MITENVQPDVIGAFIAHPLNAQETRDELAKKYSFLQNVPPNLVCALMPHVVRDGSSMLYRGCTKGIVSEHNGKILDMHYQIVPMMPYQILKHVKKAQRRLLYGGQSLVDEHGVEVIGVGATLKGGPMGGGIPLSDSLHRPEVLVTGGNDYTSFMCFQSVLDVAYRAGYDPSEEAVAVIPASGAIGRVTALLLSKHFKKVLITSRKPGLLEWLRKEIGESRCEICTPEEAVKRARFVVTVSGAPGKADLKPEWFPQSGTFIFDVARPRDVDPSIAALPWVFVCDGAMVNVPKGKHYQPVQKAGQLGKDVIVPCQAGTMVLAFEQNQDLVALGSLLDPEKVQEIGRLGLLHGFTLAGLRYNEKLVDDTVFNEFVEQTRRFRERTRR